MNSNNFYRFFFLAIFSLLVAEVSQASDLEAPQFAIQTASNKLKEKLQDEHFLDDFSQVTAFVDETVSPNVDFNRISALVLGKLWRKATKQEKSRFRQEFQILLVRTYSRAFADFKEWSVSFLPLHLKQGDKKIIVKTEILQPGKQPISVNYRMLRTQDGWKAYDIMIEGVSLVTNYRTSIKNEYNKLGSISAVIEGLAKRNKNALNKKQDS